MSDPGERRARCARCGSANVVPIAYGLPDRELEAAAARGEVALGGCLVTGDDPTHACRDCGHEW